MYRRALLVALVFIGLAPHHAAAKAYYGYEAKCVEDYERGSQVVQGTLRVVHNARLVGRLATSARRNRILDGAVVRANVTVLPPMYPPTNGHVAMNATVEGTATLRNGTQCRVAGDAFSVSGNHFYARWGGLELGIRCPDGAGFALGIFDVRDRQPYGNGGGVPGVYLCDLVS
jgi:hypothetical protein